MRNFTGYFFAASKPGGVMMNPCTRTRPMEGNQKDSILGKFSSTSSAVFKWVRCFSARMLRLAATGVGARETRLDRTFTVSTTLRILFVFSDTISPGERTVVFDARMLCPSE